MKKPKDVAELASRLTSAATTPLVSSPVAIMPVAEEADPIEETAARSDEALRADFRPVRKPRKAPNRTTRSLFLRLPETLFVKYDEEAVRRTKATGRGVTAQQVILELLEKGRPTA